MGCEFQALKFLQMSDIRQIAAPLAADTNFGVAIYDFIDGQPLGITNTDNSEIDQAVDFLKKLKAAADSGNAAHFPPASEACFSIQAILQNVDDRFRRLKSASENDSALATFLQEQFSPFRRDAETWSTAYCFEHGIAQQPKFPGPNKRSAHRISDSTTL